MLSHLKMFEFDVPPHFYQYFQLKIFTFEAIISFINNWRKFPLGLTPREFESVLVWKVLKERFLVKVSSRHWSLEVLPSTSISDVS